MSQNSSGNTVPIIQESDIADGVVGAGQPDNRPRAGQDRNLDESRFGVRNPLPKAQAEHILNISDNPAAEAVEGVTSIKEITMGRMLKELGARSAFGLIGGILSEAYLPAPVLGDTRFGVAGGGGFDYALLKNPEPFGPPLQFLGLRKGVFSDPAMDDESRRKMIKTAAYMFGFDTLKPKGDSVALKEKTWLFAHEHNIEELMKEARGEGPAKLLKIKTFEPLLNANVRQQLAGMLDSAPPEIQQAFIDRLGFHPLGRSGPTIQSHGSAPPPGSEPPQLPPAPDGGPQEPPPQPPPMGGGGAPHRPVAHTFINTVDMPWQKQMKPGQPGAQQRPPAQTFINTVDMPEQKQMKAGQSPPASAVIDTTGTEVNPAMQDLRNSLQYDGKGKPVPKADATPTVAQTAIGSAFFDKSASPSESQPKTVRLPDPGAQEETPRNTTPPPSQRNTPRP